jgi:hypothetical protein
VAKKKRSKRETIRGMTTGYDELDPALWGLPQPPPRDDESAAESDEDSAEEPNEDNAKT